MQDYRRLIAWQKNRELAKLIYAITAEFPKTERFGLAQQMRRSAISVSSNIAEGCGRDSHRELLRFLAIASGSAHELESQVAVAHDLGMIAEGRESDRLDGLLSEVKALITGLRRAIRRNEK